MIKTTSKTLNRLAHDYLELKNQSKILKSQEDALRTELLVALENESAMKTDDYIVLASKQSMSTIDRKALIAALGEQEVVKYTKVTNYVKLEVKVA